MFAVHIDSTVWHTIDGERVGTGHWHSVWEDARLEIVEC